MLALGVVVCFFLQAEDGIRDGRVTGVQTCALPIWWVAGPLIGLFVPALLVLGNRQFGFSSNLRHLCAALAPGEVAFFKYDWKQSGVWNLAFLVGTVVGGLIGGRLLGDAAVPLLARAHA